MPSWLLRMCALDKHRWNSSTRSRSLFHNRVVPTKPQPRVLENLVTCSTWTRIGGKGRRGHAQAQFRHDARKPTFEHGSVEHFYRTHSLNNTPVVSGNDFHNIQNDKDPKNDYASICWRGHAWKGSPLTPDSQNSSSRSWSQLRVLDRVQ